MEWVVELRWRFAGLSAATHGVEVDMTPFSHERKGE